MLLFRRYPLSRIGVVSTDNDSQISLHSFDKIPRSCLKIPNLGRLPVQGNSVNISRSLVKFAFYMVISEAIEQPNLGPQK